MEQVHKHREEIINALTHGAGAVLSVIAGIVLTILAVRSGDAWMIAGVAVYCVTLVTLFTASTLYHSARRHVTKARLRIFDQCAIYLLIAGTYTPFALGPMRGPWGWSLLGTVWGIALVGILYRCAIAGSRRASAIAYLAMSWLCIVAAVPAVRLLGSSTLAFLVAGGLVYTAGTVFYNSRRIPYAHPIWHAFVLVGGALHYAAVVAEVGS